MWRGARVSPILKIPYHLLLTLRLQVSALQLPRVSHDRAARHVVDDGSLHQFRDANKAVIDQRTEPLDQVMDFSEQARDVDVENFLTNDAGAEQPWFWPWTIKLPIPRASFQVGAK
jgi:hypothetical protein